MKKEYLKWLCGGLAVLMLSGCAVDAPAEEAGTVLRGEGAEVPSPTNGVRPGEGDDILSGQDIMLPLESTPTPTLEPTPTQGVEWQDDLDEDRFFMYQVSDTGELILTENNAAVNPSGEDGNLETDTDSTLPNNGETVDEAIFTSVMIQEGFFSSAKLGREQMRAKNKEALMAIVSDNTVADELKQNAIDEIIAITARAEMENAAEILLEARGYEGVVVSLSETEADVVVNAESITEQQIAQIEDIVSRKTGIGAEGIVITTVIIEE